MSLAPEVRRGGNLPFGMVASRWMCDPRYSTNARTLYAILVTYADTQQRNTERGKPYRAELAAQLGVSVSTVDRTLVELEAAGMVRVEKRVDPTNPANNEASVYHLKDFPLMYAGNGEWTDPLPAGAKAADVAKSLVEARRAEKRKAGVERRGGVPKGVNPMAVRVQKQAAKAPAEPEGGSSTHAATPGSTHAARVAAPMLPNIQNPLHNPGPDPDAPSAHSAPDARRASTGSRARGKGGSAASGKNKPRTRAERRAIEAVREELGRVIPELNRALGAATPQSLGDAILSALAPGTAAERTAGQVILYRVLPRWTKHWADLFYSGQLPKQPIGPVIAMLGSDRSDHDRCEERIDVDTGAPCQACAIRSDDRRADREKAREHPDAPQALPVLPAPRPGALPDADTRPRGTCARCEDPIFIIGPAVDDGLCKTCRHALV